MAKRKPEPGGQGPKKKRDKGPAKELPDRRAVEAAMAKAIAGLRGEGPETPLDKAQDLIYQAFKEPDKHRQVELAQEALHISADCADAYVLLAENAPNRKEALRLYEQGFAAGERALGPQVFQRDAGHFWGILETRPYMRARQALAHFLWTAGRRDEAVQHLQDMLRLNPNDNQGVRYTLANFLLFLDRDEDLARLLEQYPREASATWAYTKPLLAFRRDGNTVEARRLLKEARKTNKHVLPYLRGEKYPAEGPPNYISPGSEGEALDYLQGFLGSWKSTPGAIAWLRDLADAKKPKENPPGKGPLGFVKQWLTRNLPQQTEVWQADFRPMPNWMSIGGRLLRPWVVLVINPATDLVIGHVMLEYEPSANLLWDALVQSMRHPAVGAARRPTEIQVRQDDRWEGLRPHLDEIGVELAGVQDMDPLDHVYKSMCDHVCGPAKPGLLDMPGITPEQVAGFYDAAAAFFLQLPWKKVGYESPIRVECDKFESGPWFGVLMGQSGLSLGLALYEDLEALGQIWSHPRDEETYARRSVATTVTFEEQWDIPVADLEAAKAHGWTVARPDAYPEVMHKDRGMTSRPPLAWELELVEACLRTVPDFVSRRQQDDPTREEYTTQAASKPIKLVLSWVVDVTGG